MCHRFENSQFIPPSPVNVWWGGRESTLFVKTGEPKRASKGCNSVLLVCASPQRKILWHKEQKETVTVSFGSSKASVSLSFAFLVLSMEKFSEGKSHQVLTVITLSQAEFSVSPAHSHCGLFCPCTYISLHWVSKTMWRLSTSSRTGELALILCMNILSCVHFFKMNIRLKSLPRS